MQGIRTRNTWQQKYLPSTTTMSLSDNLNLLSSACDAWRQHGHRFVPQFNREEQRHKVSISLPQQGVVLRAGWLC